MSSVCSPWPLRRESKRVLLITGTILEFGAAHAYQGMRGIFGTGIAGAIAMGRVASA